MPAGRDGSVKLVVVEWPINVAARGAKDAADERWMSYAVTPTASVAAVQDRATDDAEAVAVSEPGAVGRVVSGAGRTGETGGVGGGGVGADVGATLGLGRGAVLPNARRGGTVSLFAPHAPTRIDASLAFSPRSIVSRHRYFTASQCFAYAHFRSRR